MSDSRLDANMSELVYKGLRIDVDHGTVKAWVYMMTYHVPPEVIARVLSLSKRRKEDPQAITKYDEPLHV